MQDQLPQVRLADDGQPQLLLPRQLNARLVTAGYIATNNRSNLMAAHGN